MPVDKAIYQRVSMLPERLPRRARLAYCVRAVRRLQPQLQLGWPTARQDVVTMVESALSQVEAHCGGAKRPELASTHLLAQCLPEIDGRAGVCCACIVVRDTADLLRVCRTPKRDWRPPGVFALYYLQVPWIRGEAHDSMVRHHLLELSEDLDLLLDQSKQLRWTDESAVPPAELGPLWRWGTPQWMRPPWPDEEVCSEF